MSEDPVNAELNVFYGKDFGQYHSEIREAMICLLGHGKPARASTPQVTDEAVEKALDAWLGRPYRMRSNREDQLGDMRRVLEQFAASAPARSESTSGEWVLRSEVIRVCKELGEQSADLALYGAPDNARSREAMEAAALRLSCAMALLPGVSFAASAPAVTGECVMVPRKMTPEMETVWLEGDFGEPQDCWDAMLAAALSADEEPDPDRLRDDRDENRRLEKDNPFNE